MASLTTSTSAVAFAALLRLKGIGRRAALRIVDSPMPEIDAQQYLLQRTRGAKLSEDDVIAAWHKAEDDLGCSADHGIKALSIHDEGYPERLKNIPDPPVILYVKGDVAGLKSERSLAVIGTREPTPYGEKVAKRSAASAVEEGYVIVSGLAHGCDTLAHEGCLDQMGIGIAVMAHGLDKVYPAANRGLAARLLDAGGCLVSEYPLGMTPMRTAFAERDRIQSGLSDAVLVIETDVKGGTMHTVRFSRDQKRALACIKHPDIWRHEDKTRGNQMLIADRWAEAIPDGEALLSFLRKLCVQGSVRSEEPCPTIPKTQMCLDF
ncbi:DNA-processing protein DprA [Sphingorhabdus contaminans]|uniref:DNA-processing protein DprA n=1 Tax=Sphingorhabdus contaminans TaxID=1343899 RepID=A0A553WAA7_9SPHN|nr:DNA-processing protein DprA [Sphingorhabdus contaminans]TSB01620.1 DNA-processing protein DprA [Sphingorhabdus contaminans]